jgi:hypothetical protein
MTNVQAKVGQSQLKYTANGTLRYLSIPKTQGYFYDCCESEL